ncbi:hypothetical protein B0H14DRAFT_3422628 [Mycena olivaceomarginata]|nr:hypothetical protein B0H14DRAFT_3422628 [Mycena olivaceomarginata]
MDKGTKRKRDSSIAILSYSAPGYKFAKFFTETSLDEIKETVRKRLVLASVSDFTLSYDTDSDTGISLENDDDFDVFEVRSHTSASSVHVVVKILSPSHTAPANVAGSSAVIPSAVPVDGGARWRTKKRKSTATLVEGAPAVVGSAPVPAASGEKTPGDDQEPLKKKRKKVKKNDASGAAKASDGVQQPPENTAKEVVDKDVTDRPNPPAPSTAGKIAGAQSGEGLPVISAQEPIKKKSKKVVEKDFAKTNPAAPLNTGDASGAEIPGGKPRKTKFKKVAEQVSDAAPPISPPVPSTTGDKGPTPLHRFPPSADNPARASAAAETQGEQGKAKPKKAAEQGPETASSKPSTSKKSTKSSKKDNQTEHTDGPVHKSVKFTFPGELAQVISSNAEENESISVVRQQKGRELSSSEKVKKAKGKKKAAENVEDVGSSAQAGSRESPVDPESLKDFWKSLLPALPLPTPDNRTEPQATKKLASGTKSSNQTVTTENSTAPTLCPVCETSPFHLRYRCPVVLAGPGPIRQRIAELQQDDATDNSKLIQELRGLAAKSQKNKADDPPNFNAHPPPRVDAREGGAPSVTVPERKPAATFGIRPDADDSDSSSDDSKSGPSRRKKAAPRPVGLSADDELDTIIRGPVSSRLTVDDILLDEEDENEETAESVVLENDDEDDIKFRRRSRQIEAAASSGEEDDDDDEESFSAGKVAESEPPSVINTLVRVNPHSEAEPLGDAAEPTASPVVEGSIHGDSRRSSLRSQTEPLSAIAARQSVDVDLAGDIAVGDAMASDNAMFGLEASGSGNEGSMAENVDSVDFPLHSAVYTPIPLTPKRTRLRTPPAVDERGSDRPHTPKFARREDDPIQPAEDFPPTPTQVPLPATPYTPRMVQRMKDRNGKIPVKLSQLELPFSLNPQTHTQPAETAREESLPATQPSEDTVPKKTTRRSTRITPALSTASLPISPSEAEQPAKRRRGPNKTPEQRAQEAAAKLAAKEEKERLRKEKAEARGKGKVEAKENGRAQAKGAGKKDTQDLPAEAPPVTLQPEDSTSTIPVELSETDPTHSRTPMSQDEWTLHSSSSPSNGGDEAPLFLPAESQIPFPYSQWNSVPEFCPGSPKGSQKDSEDEDEEEEVRSIDEAVAGVLPRSTILILEDADFTSDAVTSCDLSLGQGQTGRAVWEVT